MITEEKGKDRISELKRKIQQEEYMQTAIHEIASLLTESINRGHFLIHERK